MTSFFNILHQRSTPLFFAGLACLLAAIICIVLIATTNKQVLGINAWIKPLKFFLSSTIFIWTIAWLLGYLGQESQFKAYSWMIIGVLAFETIYIAWKASEGQLSHFNITSSFHASMFALMGIAIAIMTTWTAYIGLLFFTRSFPELPSYYLWGIRLGIILFVIFAFQGFMMGGQLSHTVGAPDGGKGLPLVNWSTEHGDLRIAHFLGMHALQIIPLVSYYLIKNIPGVFIFALLYLLITTFILFQAMSGIPLIRI